MPSKVGVFICRCSDNIASKVDVEKLAMELRQWGDVAFVETHALLCAAYGQAFLEHRLKKSHVSRVVVAACSPKDHEHTFQKCMTNAGKNRFLLQMANIREQCTWVTPRSIDAYRKSRSLIKAAIRRVQLHERLREKEIDCITDVAVVGGGIAGIEATLNAARDGRHVTLIEKTPSIGGMIARLEELAPTMECAPCMLSPRILEIEEAENIDVLTNCDIESVDGYFGNFEIQVTQRPRMVDVATCIGCDECIQVCPVETPGAFDFGMTTRKAIDVLFPGCSPNCAAVDVTTCLKTTGGDCNACVDACPVDAVDFSQEEASHMIRAGAIIMATGAQTLNPTDISQFGYGTYPDVVTHAQFARLTSNHGPTGGRVLRRDGSVPSKIVFVHCVGRSRLGYCSRYCCTAAFGLSVTALRGNDAISVVHVIQDDMCSDEPGVGLFTLLQQKNKARASNDTVVRVTDVNRINVRASQTSGNRLLLTLSEHQARFPIDADMVVLVTGTLPSSESVRLMEKLELVATKGGFVAADHLMLRPAQSSIDGIYVAGMAGGPKGFSKSVLGAKAASGDVLSRLVPGKKLTLKSMVAHTSSDVCSGCGVCLQVCPYHAVRIDPEKKDVAQVNEVLCQGCGTCVATCPSGAASARHFTEEQLNVEIAEVLRD
ncbi:MAG: CoB--CoM heterodisulfide reductase iron-sulfur subunit A family protein [Deltaproteobacteria bacterium]|nr:CoB--CoM heterodisulfide reductase iron-sulfur subunit A family protein [Deltaproteobacteria bacterium]